MPERLNIFNEDIRIGLDRKWSDLSSRLLIFLAMYHFNMHNSDDIAFIALYQYDNSLLNPFP